ncbi:PHP domain-containing protein [Paenibacillus psychroresistens]|uniref:PHP domain-containing protein n=2 Tax=Paenibacillus psychroresistens TaxID=1778678 RepID=A0A6B8RWB0_9BACL|nr:PHP domain-containing protein [Paenibacillus psychroresistens]
MRWAACELHTHTFHSDGKQTLLELAKAAKSLGFDSIALTDHNTMTGLQGRESIEAETDLTIIPGMEWTTFYGHMVTIGMDAFVDWRAKGIGDIHQGIAEIHAQGGVAGMAHPFRIGSPICTGCFWEYEISNWNEIDYIEVWSGTFPSIKKDNLRAYQLWTDKLNEGYRIAATSGRDWHFQVETEDPISVTYLGLEAGEDSLRSQAVKAISQGRISVTIGPLITMEIEKANESYKLGDLIPLDHTLPAAEQAVSQAHIHVDFSVRSGIWEIADQDFTLLLTGNTGIVSEQKIRFVDAAYSFAINRSDLIWARAELWGTVRGARVLIAFTNAIYFEVKQ